MTLIDVHAHVVPRTFPDNPAKGVETRWPCMCHRAGNLASVWISGKSFREVDHRSWDVEVRLCDMDASGVTRQVLSPMPELLSYWFSPAIGLDMCRWMNHSLAAMVALKPSRFSALAIVPMQDAALSARELTAIKANGFVGIELGSNINGVVLGDARFEEFWAEAERLDLAIFVHALHPIGADRLQSLPDLVPFAAFPLDTALTAISLIRTGVPDRYPHLRFGFSHGGGAIIPLVHRLGQGAKVTRNFNHAFKKTPALYAAEFFYDSLVYDPGYLTYLADHFAPAQVFCGTDYPYAIMETDPAGFISAAATADSDALRFGAARRFLNLNTE